MGFRLQTYDDNRVDLIVAFEGLRATRDYTPAETVEGAMEYFKLYIYKNELYKQNDNTQIYEKFGVVKEEEVEQLRQAIDELALTLNDEQAANTPILFKIWLPSITMNVGERYRYNDKLYKVLQQHVSQYGWEPDKAPSLFARILTSENSEPIEWEQPNSTNGYAIGDKVIHNGKVWVSTANDNVWEPGVLGAPWEIESNEEEEETISEWEQRGAENPYMTGDKVIFNEEIWESVIDNNIWSPTTYPAGWQKVE